MWPEGRGQSSELHMRTTCWDTKCFSELEQNKLHLRGRVCVWSHYFPSIKWNATQNLHQLIYITAWGANQRAWYLLGCHSCTSAWLFWPSVFHFCLVPFITVINSLVFIFLISDVIWTLIGCLTFCEDIKTSPRIPLSIGRESHGVC